MAPLDFFTGIFLLRRLFLCDRSVRCNGGNWKRLEVEITNGENY